MNLLAAMERALQTANIPMIITAATLKRPGPRTDPDLLKRLAERLKNGEPFTGQMIHYRKDGTAYQASWNISPICDGNGKITRYVSF